MHNNSQPKKINCWQYMHCGRESGGSRSGELGIRPASLEETFHGLNQGVNGGRICWAVAGTMCSGEVQGSYAKKRDSCIQCPFFRKVHQEECALNDELKFLGFLSSQTRTEFMPRLPLREVQSGERFIRQGECVQQAYIIELGSCLVLGEREEELHPVRALGPGDIAGELSLLTGEPQNAHVEALTDMRLRVLDEAKFQELSDKEPGILDFVTETIAERFDSRRLSAERRIGKYIATEAIGSGGYSIVFKGYHHSLGLPVAIKMLRHNLALRPDFQKNFWNEAQTIARFHHENIIRVYDLEEMYRTIFIIMELVQGENLKDMLLRLGSIPPLLASKFLDQIAAGLEYAHGQGILHLDINPSNMLVQTGEKIKIMDFGMACPSGVDDRGICDGTVLYMAPEQIEVETIDERTDIYSLGISAYELLTGKHPFPGEDVSQVMKAHLSQTLPDPAKVNPVIPEELAGILLKACRKNPAERYQNMSQLRSELQAVIRKLEGAQLLSGSRNPLDILGREHALIRQFLDNLAIAVEYLQSGHKPPREFFETTIRFSRLFTGRYHHFKEEQVLFCRLTLKESGLESGIRTLQYQHERGREIMAGLAQDLKSYQRGQENLIQKMIADISAYISLLRQHVHEEEHVIYPLIRKTFSKDEMQAAGEIFQQEEDRHGGGMLQAGQEMIGRMGRLLSRYGSFEAH